MMLHRHCLMVWMISAVGFSLLAGCARQKEEDETPLLSSKIRQEEGRSLFDTPPPVKGKLTSDLDVPLEERTFAESLTAEMRKHKEREQKRAAQAPPSSSAADALPPGALDAPKSSPLPASSIEELDQIGLSSFRRVPGDIQIPDVSIASRSRPPASGPSRAVVVPVAKVILRSLAEVNKLLGLPREKSVGEQYGSHDVVCYYYVSADMEPIRVLFRDGKVATSVTVTFRRPVSREEALRRVGMASPKRPPQVKTQGDLVWEGGFAWKEGRLTLEAAEDQRDKFWSVLVEALTQTARKPQVKLDESWGVGSR
ncbi:MAG: hypothetical protein NZT92_00800 [Abditibacteriales bacterium]|nr:hypothetical protein [Abditibacteriales bacterium]MDW8364932.1 hypothetical protein [Abditibacteriales bacterium]